MQGKITNLENCKFDGILYILVSLMFASVWFWQVTSTSILSHGFNWSIVYATSMIVFTSLFFLYHGVYFYTTYLDVSSNGITEMTPVLKNRKRVNFNNTKKFAILRAPRANHYFLRTIDKEGKRVNILFDRPRLEAFFIEKMAERGVHPTTERKGLFAPPYKD